MLQENVQQQLVQVLNTKNNSNVNVINTNSSLKNSDQRNVVCDSLLLEQKCAPEAANSCEQIPVGNNLALQSQKENISTAAKTCLIRENTSNASSKEEKVYFVSNGKVKLTNDITDGVDKLNLNDKSLKCGNELVGAAAPTENIMISKEKQNSAVIMGGSSHQNRSTSNHISLMNKEIEYRNRLPSNLINHRNNNGNNIYSKSKNHPRTTKLNVLNNEAVNAANIQSTKSLTEPVEILPQNISTYQASNLTDRYLKTLAHISANSDGKSDLQTILQRQRLKSESHLLQFPQSSRITHKDNTKACINVEERHLHSPGYLSRVGSTESINTQMEGTKSSHAFTSLRNQSIESLTTISIPKRCNSEDNLSVFSGRYDPVDVSSSLNSPSKTVPSAIVKARPAVVREDQGDSLSYIYDTVEMEDQYPNDELYESIAGSMSDLSVTQENKDLTTHKNANRYIDISTRNDTNHYIKNNIVNNDAKSSLSSSNASSFSR